MDRNALGSFWRQTIFGCLAYQNHSMLITLRSYEPAGLKLVRADGILTHRRCRFNFDPGSKADCVAVGCG
ncbi:protein of unknown function [Thiomonas sp. Bio17B3]|jgi:hypothetical protein|nr:protein of unknown function [Thiomonas sp. Bio17B3]VDY10520.1 protein of unknown function [Thiomonas sp. Sup16B3]VDY16365.1 protein of unknown function [Thiomonas sp. CB2]VDY16696.1 protein of unknown function [Thiomonas sp. CB2]